MESALSLVLLLCPDDDDDDDFYFLFFLLLLLLSCGRFFSPPSPSQDSPTGVRWLYNLQWLFSEFHISPPSHEGILQLHEITALVIISGCFWGRAEVAGAGQCRGFVACSELELFLPGSLFPQLGAWLNPCVFMAFLWIWINLGTCPRLGAGDVQCPLCPWILFLPRQPGCSRVVFDLIYVSRFLLNGPCSLSLFSYSLFLLPLSLSFCSTPAFAGMEVLPQALNTQAEEKLLAVTSAQGFPGNI